MKLIIRGAEIRHLSMPIPGEGSTFMRVHYRADLTGAIRDVMGWQAIPKCVASKANLPGDLVCTSLEVKPNGDNLGQYERCLNINAVKAFQVVPLKDDEGDVKGHALEFTVETGDLDSMLATIVLAKAIGRADCQIIVNYEKPQQGALELAHEPLDDGDDDQPELEAAGEDAELGQTFEEALEAAEEREPSEDAGPLPSAVTMAGSTEKLRKARRARTPRPTSDPGAIDWDQEQRLDPNVPHSSVEVM